MASRITKKQAGRLVQDLFDNPVGQEVDSVKVLAPLWLFLEESPALPDGLHHWFCSAGDPVVVQTAIFLIRLYAYNSESVGQWRKRMEGVLTQCVDCVHGLELAKFASRDSYFSAFSPPTLDAFYESFDAWEAQYALSALQAAGLTSSRGTSATLAHAPPAVSYHLVMNLHLLQHVDIVNAIRAHVPPEPIIGWPTDPPAAALLILMMDDDLKVRRWAKAQAMKCTVVPIANDIFIGPHLDAFKAIAQALSSAGASMDQPSVAFPSLSRDPAALWSGFVSVLRLVPDERLTSSAHFNLDIRRVIIDHLRDQGPQFIDILQALLILLQRMGASLWKGEGPGYPQVVFDSIKDNIAFLDIIQRCKTSERPWFLSWFSDYLQSISEASVFGDVLAKVVDFLCEELQNERFSEARPATMSAAIRMLTPLVRKAADELQKHSPAISRVVDRHTSVLVNVAFAHSHGDSTWSATRSAAREFIRKVFGWDIQELMRTSQALVRKMAKASNRNMSANLPVIPVPSIRVQMWSQTYATLQSKDAEGISVMVTALARCSHYDTLTRKAFLASFSMQPGETNFVSSEPIFKAINAGLEATRLGFLDVTAKFANYNDSTAVQNLLRRPGIGKDVMILMLSPVESIQAASQSLVGLAFDVDTRMECFRALLENLRDATMSGIFEFLEIFIEHAPIVPEACSLSKSLVRCLTDIIEVLCTREGLLRGPAFMKCINANSPPPDLLKLWSLMTKSITVIFKRTPLWSSYFENEAMTEWMRDALIFGRDLMAQRTVIADCAVEIAVPASKGKSSKASRVGKRMVNELQDVLVDLARWMRLTDEELLHQSFALLETILDCFRQNDVRPSDDAMTRLNKYVEEARKKVPDHLQIRLDKGRLAKLELALSSFDEEDEIEIISHNIPEREPERKRKVTAPVVSEAKKAKVKEETSARQPAQRPLIGGLTAVDRQRLASASAFPSMRDQQPVASSSRIAQPGQRPKDRGPKNEGGKPVAAPQVSSSEEESSSEEDAGAISFPRPRPIIPKIKKAPEPRRQVKLLEQPGHRGNALQDRTNRRDDARRNAMRLKPDISHLHRVVLSWDYEHTGDEPPNKPRLSHVPDRFESHEHYRSVFEPLLVMECWSQLIKSKDEPQDMFECKIAARQFSDQWLDLEITIDEDVRRDWYLTETDVVLLRHLDGKKHVLAKVQSYRATPRGIQGNLRVFSGGGISDPGLHIGSSWRLSKVFSLSTLHREYAALMALPYYDLTDSIFKPHLSKPSKDSSVVSRTMQSFGLNEPQAAAISASLRTDGFALIQGPPGTGKTSTIVGLIDAFLAQRTRAATAITVGRQAPPPQNGPTQKVLLCAPSNAAVDEVAHRLIASSRGSEKRTVPKVVRIGTQKSMGIAVKSISLDYLVEQKMNLNTDPSANANNEMAKLRQDLENVKQLKHTKQEESNGIRDNSARVHNLEEEIRSLNSRRMAITQQLDRLRDKQKSDNRGMDAAKRKFRAQVLNEADVICCTLSGAGHESLEQFDFEMVVIDEAAQAIELSSLIPLKYRCRRCIMVGDPQQLPPTVISGEATKYHYNQSLFVRLQKHRPDAVHLLSIQYRMHPEISRLPSRLFYQGRLQDGPDMETKSKQVWQTSLKFGIYRFFNVGAGKEEHGGSGGHSVKNRAECEIAVALFNRLRQEFSSIDFDGRVGIVSMYQAQVVELRRAFERRFGIDITDKVHFHTVDGFQGQEKDVIILSCVRAGPGVQSVGFLADTRRMNVAMTRAKSSLFILGHAATLERSDANWKSIVLDAKARSLFTDVNSAYFTSPTENAPHLPALTKAVEMHVRDDIPVKLSTPKEMTQASSRSALSTKRQVETPSVVETRLAEPMPQPEVLVQRKRPREDEEPQAVAGPSKPKPKLKKAKTGPNLFIPKNNKKPPPPGTSSGRRP